MPSGFLGGGIGPVALKRRRAAAADWWQVAGQTCVAAYQPIGAASLAASYTNLANPGVNNAAPGVAPTLVAGGWSFNGSTQYLRVQIGAITTAISVVLRYAGAISAYSAAVGSSANGAARLALAPRNAGDGGKRGYRHGGVLLSGAGSDAAGIMALCGNAGYFNGSPETAPFSTSIGTGDIGIGAYYDPTGYWTGTIAALAIYSTTLSAADVAALTTRMQALA